MSDLIPDIIAEEVFEIGKKLHAELAKAVIENPASDTAYGVNIGLEKAAILVSKVCKLENNDE